MSSLASCDGADPSSASRATSAGSSDAAPGDASNRVVRSTAVLRAEREALDDGHVRDFGATWAPGVPRARRHGRIVAANLRSLGVSHVRLHAIASSLGQQAADTPKAGASRRGWALDVDVTWRLGGEESTALVTRLAYHFVAVRGHVYVADVTAAPGAREPIWLRGRLEVRRSPVGLVAAATAADATTLAALVRRAGRDVRDVLPRWSGYLVAYLPSTTEQFAAVLGVSKGEDNRVAAVTTPVDGSTGDRAPKAIVVNPRIWPLLRPVGAHVVITHEAVHAATPSVSPALPLWVTEGFADYVAIRAARVPTETSSAAAVRLVRSHGSPRRLPTDRSFAATNRHLETSYELSRLVIQTIVRHHGRAGLLDFYRDAVTHPGDLGGALRRQLGTSPSVLTRQWRRLLVRLAGA